MSKVFVIGLQKTGTISMAGVLTTLGYDLCIEHIAWKTDPSMDLETLREKALEATSCSDAFVNNPWPIFYEDLHEKHPDAKFILTLRDQQDWLESATKHFAGQSRSEIPLIYGVEKFDGHEQDFLDFYVGHNLAVQDFFRDKPNSLLVIDITKHGDWKPICDFLEQPIPECSFPHKNKTGSLRQQFQRFVMPAITKVRSIGNNGPASKNQ